VPESHAAPTEAADRPGLADRLAPWMAALLVTIAVAMYLRTLFYGYILDDTTAIRANPLVQSWHGLISAWSNPFWAEQGGASRSGLYRPLLVSIFTVIWNAGHKFALWFHLLAIAAHAMATWLVWRMLRVGVGIWIAFGAAIWFAVHPVHVEAIASVANVSEVLVALATLWLAFVIRRASDAAQEPADIGWNAATKIAVLFAAAALTKESGFVAPALAALWAWGWRAAAEPRAFAFEDLRRCVARWWRPLAACALVVVAIFIARRAVLGSAVGNAAMAAPGLEGLTTWQRTWAMLALGPRAIGLLFWPTMLLPHYGPEVLTATGPSLAGATTLLLMISAGAAALMFARRGDRRPLAAVGWMLIAFAPASNLFVATGQILAERTLYGASIGAAMLVAWAAARVLDGARMRSRSVVYFARGVVVALFALSCARTAGVTIRYEGVWQSHARLFAYLVSAQPDGYRGHWLLALQAERSTPPAADSALHEFSRAYADFPNDRQLTIDYTDALLAANRPANAAAIAAALMNFPDMRTNENAVALYLRAVTAAYGADSARALAGTLAPGAAPVVPR